MKGEEIKIAAVNNFKSLQKRVPHGQVARILDFHCHGPGSILGRGAEVLQAMWHGPKKKFARKSERNRVTVKE